MKKLLLVVCSLFASAGIYAQCNLSITNNTNASLELLGAESDAYDCMSQVAPTTIVTVEAGSTFSLEHEVASKDKWIGIHITSPVNEPYRNYLAGNCIAEKGTYKVVWTDECSVTIE